MKKKQNCKLIIALFLVVFHTSCENDTEMPYVEESEPIQFTSEIDNKAIETKAYNATWENGDKIGVFMKSAGVSLSNAAIIDGSSNKMYATTGNGVFMPATNDHSIYFPSDNSNVDFIAYYPRQSTLNNYIYKVNVTDQSIPQNIDLLYSNNLVGINSNSTSRGLTFTHQLSKINFNISASNNISDISALSISISGVKTLADFDLADGSLSVINTSAAAVLFKTTATGSTAFSEAILLPDDGGNGRIVTFKLPSVGTFSWTIPSTTKLQKGRKYTYNIKLDASGIVIDPSYGWAETPSMSTLSDEEVYITHMIPNNNGIRNYSMLYDKKYKLAHWVAYPLHRYYVGGSGRNDVWAYDPKIGPEFQPYLKNAFPESGIDRGHQIPSADRTKDYATNITTFYYTNMTAQVGTMNQQIWARLEDNVRTLMDECDTLYVVTGAMITTKKDKTIIYTNDRNGNAIAKPKYYYKALAQRIGNTYKTLGFLIENSSSVASHNYMNYSKTVKELEDETGYTFFPSIPKSAKRTKGIKLTDHVIN